MKTHYSAPELAAMSLNGFPKSSQAINLKAKKEGFSCRPRVGGKGLEYALESLPADVQAQIREQHYQALLKQQPAKPVAVKAKTSATPGEKLALMRQCPALLEREVGALTSKQKLIADARAALAMEVQRLEMEGLSRIKAIEFISGRSRTGDLPEHLMQLVNIANARKGKRVGVGVRTLNEWVLDYLKVGSGTECLAVLAPGHLKAKKPEDIAWLGDFRTHYNTLTGLTMSEAYRRFSAAWEERYHDQPAMAAACPSIHIVRRVMNKLPRREKMRGRVSAAAMLAYEDYIRRDWSMLPVNGCWIADGKSLDMKVADPAHGRPITPELTLVMDGRTRMVVGWSLARSESAIAVMDAYRHAMQRYGKPLFVYSDNGSGETNKMLDAEITGIFPRMGVRHLLSIPGRAQSRGIIERLNGVVPKRIAQRFATYNGGGADRENVRVTDRAIRSALGAEENGHELTPAQRVAKRKLPSWQQLLDVIEGEVNKYNETHRHSELPKLNGRHMTPAECRRAALEAEGDEIEYPDAAELREMFLPQEIRTANRGVVEVGNNFYYSSGLADVDGQQVRVAYDIREPNEVIVRRMDGTYVCTAVWNGNKKAPVAMSKVEIAEEERRQRRLKRTDEKRREIEAEGRPLVIGEPFDLRGFIPAEQPEEEEEPIFFLQTDRDEYLKKKAAGQSR